MSIPIRYGLADEHLGRIHQAKDGHLVMWSDYSALAAEYVELKDLYLKCRIDIGNLHKENERLRKAGDAMADDLRSCQADEDDALLVAWNAAKEGRDAK